MSGEILPHTKCPRSASCAMSTKSESRKQLPPLQRKYISRLSDCGLDDLSRSKLPRTHVDQEESVPSRDACLFRRGASLSPDHGQKYFADLEDDASGRHCIDRSLSPVNGSKPHARCDPIDYSQWMAQKSMENQRAEVLGQELPTRRPGSTEGNAMHIQRGAAAHPTAAAPRCVAPVSVNPRRCAVRPRSVADTAPPSALSAAVQPLHSQGIRPCPGTYRAKAS